MKKKSVAATYVQAFIFIVFGLASQAGATTIDTTTNGNEYTRPSYYFGNSGINHFGQVFNIGNDTDTQLDTITFSLAQTTDAEITFDFNIYAWDGDSISGSALFTSSNLSTTTKSILEEFSIEGIDLTLTNNTDYIFTLDATHNASGGRGPIAVTPAQEELYQSGMAVYLDSEDSYNSWSIYPGSRDLAFIMETSSSSAVPEPATMLLFGTGLAGLAATGRKKK